MNGQGDVYDLGELSLEENRRGVTTALPRRAMHGSAPSFDSGPGPGLAASFSLFIPGAGQFLTGEKAVGVFFMTSIGFVVSLAHGFFMSQNNILPTLDLFHIPRVALGLAYGILAIAGASLHLASVVHAHDTASGRAASPAHPVVSGLASAIVPGWGQLLVGHKARAVLFLSCLWISGTAWLLVSPNGTSGLRAIGLSLPEGVKSVWGPVVLITVPALTWTLAVYDGVVGAVSARR